MKADKKSIRRLGRMALISENADSLSGGNRTLATRFMTLKTGQGLKPSSLFQYAHWIQRLDEHCEGKPWLDVDEHDCSSFLAHLREQNMANSTVMQASHYLKAFLTWVRDEDRLPRKMREALKVRDNPRLPQGKILGLDDCHALLSATPRLMYQALVGVLWETGFRVSELLALRVWSVQVDKKGGAWLHLPPEAEDLKTGPRKVYLARWTPLLEAWLAMHPHNDQPDSPLWPSDHKRHAGKAIVKESLYKILRKIFADANMAYRSPHWFRHSAATRDAENGYSETDLRIKYGWSTTSKMPSIYVHYRVERAEALARRSAKIGIDGIQPKREQTEGDKELAALARALKSLMKKDNDTRS